jgi:hypothetical protein
VLKIAVLFFKIANVVRRWRWVQYVPNQNIILARKRKSTARKLTGIYFFIDIRQGSINKKSISIWRWIF